MEFDDRALEIEALRSIYTEDELLYDENRNIVSIHLSREGTYRLIRIAIKISLPKEYPQLSPIIYFEDIQGINDQQELEQLYKFANNCVQSHIGEICIFNIIENIQGHIDELVQLKPVDPHYNQCQYSSNTNQSLLKSTQDEGEVVYKDLSDKILCNVDKRVTESEFNKWKDSFKSEMIDKGIWKSNNNIGTSLTGKQLFELDNLLIKSDINSVD
ncbi:RWD domain-containing protein [Cryptosporidium muris RN66]|uniref:RWD domain-containing protein n=1 Tax=Cryptosporidium muris (strain RN66) TaxID=441375 RepID=B6A9K9_CRYMR|nr:RWD domain-containing protein [Cryptosporidium muris RN66]EEA04900.1 RWD domain-containing protein [Cryptosporidium muris RN66]|eukprot:XP_002139249.1 RWD domain-containing protein [Cryptosporidium muris RN66]